MQLCMQLWPNACAPMCVCVCLFICVLFRCYPWIEHCVFHLISFAAIQIFCGNYFFLFFFWALAACQRATGRPLMPLQLNYDNPGQATHTNTPHAAAGAATVKLANNMEKSFASFRTSTSTAVGRMLNTRMQFVRQDMWQARCECATLPTHTHKHTAPRLTIPYPCPCIAVGYVGSCKIYANACASRTHNSHNL